MTFGLPGSSGNGQVDWNAPQVPAENHCQRPVHRERAQRREVSSALSWSVGESSDSSRPPTPLRQRHLQTLQAHEKPLEGKSPKRGKLQQLKGVANLFQSSMALRNASVSQPLEPFNPESDNANDVYMTHFSVLNQKNLDVVFKPGKAAAMRSKICYGLTQLFKPLSQVIVPAKEGQATVISREDYGVARTKIYNPEAKCAYLVEKAQLTDQFSLKGKKEAKGKIEGMVGSQRVELEAVAGHAGFYHMRLVPAQEVSVLEETAPSSEDESGFTSVSDEDWGADDEWDDDDSIDDLHQSLLGRQSFSADELDSAESSRSEEEAETDQGLADGYVMRTSSILPSRIDTWVDGELAWIQLTDGKASYLVPVDEMMEVHQERDGKSWVSIDDAHYAVKVYKNHTFVLYRAERSLNKELAKQYHLLQQADGRQVLVPKTACLAYEEGDDTVTCDSKTYAVEMGEEEGWLQLRPLEAEANESFVLVDEGDWLAAEAITSRHGKDYVRRNDQDYHLTTENGKVQVVGENIDGMVQLKIESIFQKPAGATRALDLLTPSKERAEFYSRIDMPSFIQAFIATVLLRPQDGKIVDLAESNVLFQALPDGDGNVDPLNPACKLQPVIIDLDETMPPANDYTQDPEFVKPGEQTDIHAIRNGLMGFPQARQMLAGAEKQQAADVLAEIVAKRQEVAVFLRRYVGNGAVASFNQHHIDAYQAVVDKVDLFLREIGQRDWSLQQLFFAVFPEYEQQWQALGDMSPERKAMHIGKDSIAKVLARGIK